MGVPSRMFFTFGNRLDLRSVEEELGIRLQGRIYLCKGSEPQHCGTSRFKVLESIDLAGVHDRVL